MFVNCPQGKIILGNLFRILKWNFLQGVKDTIKKFQNTLVKANSKTPVANKVTYLAKKDMAKKDMKHLKRGQTRLHKISIC